MDQTTQPDDKAFEDSFNSERGDTSPPEAKPGPQEQEAAQAPEAPAPEAAPEPDKFEVLKREMDGLKSGLESKLAQFEKYPDRLRNIEGYIGGINTQLKAALAVARTVEKGGGDVPSKERIEQGLKDPEIWERNKADYPDWAEATEAFTDSRIKSAIATVREEVAQEVSRRLASNTPRVDVGQALSQAEELAVLRVYYPDWRKTVNTKEFGEWKAKQPPEVRALADSSSANDAIRMIHAFEAASKAAAKAHQQENSRRLQGATTPQGVGASPPPNAIDDQAAFEGGFKKALSGG